MKYIFTFFYASHRPLLCFGFFLMLSFNSQAQIYVNHAATGNNDGTSWENAYTRLSDALLQADDCNEIWVAAGTYLPQEKMAWPTETTKQLDTEVHQAIPIYGGFKGTERMRSQRNARKNVTILSGHLIPQDFNGKQKANVRGLANAMSTTAKPKTHIAVSS